MDKPALLGGSRTIDTPFPTQITVGREEADAVRQVMETGLLSHFIAGNRPEFYGGPKVRELEARWAERFACGHAVAVNSATSGLIAAVGAVGIGPGDEVITSPWTMSATPAAVLAFNGIPVFADIEDETYGLDPASVEARITPRTKAILVVHLAGHPARMKEIMALARRYNLAVIEDAAQSPGALCDGRLAGTIGHIGVFSLNAHKAIQCGEGGVAVTDDKELAYRMQLIRNHAEAGIAAGHSPLSLANMLGFNFRMTELEAAVAVEQLRKMDGINAHRQALAAVLSERLGRLEGLIPPVVREGSIHVYYFYGLRLDPGIAGLSRELLVEALLAEGVPTRVGYAQPLYLQPLYQRGVLYGGTSCPFGCPLYQGEAAYGPGLCPTTERLEDECFFWVEVVRRPLTMEDMDTVARAFEKTWRHRGALRAFAALRRA